jgi:hypothetical protein
MDKKISILTRMKLFKRKPKTDEEIARDSVREKTENYKPKEARFVSHTVYPLYRTGQKPTTFTVKHGAHA